LIAPNSSQTVISVGTGVREYEYPNTQRQDQKPEDSLTRRKSRLTEGTPYCQGKQEYHDVRRDTDANRDDEFEQLKAKNSDVREHAAKGLDRFWIAVDVIQLRDQRNRSV
jgi:hypothetical protein